MYGSGSQPACIIYWGTFAPANSIKTGFTSSNDFVGLVFSALGIFRCLWTDCHLAFFLPGMSALLFRADHDRGEGKMCRNRAEEQGSLIPQRPLRHRIGTTWTYFYRGFFFPLLWASD